MTVTYSLVAIDSASQTLGIAVQSATLAVGAVVPHVRPGIGVVATQAFTEPGYGPRCLDLISRGFSAGEALESARSGDPAPELRQVSVLAADGSLAAVTGERCIDYAGHLVADTCIAAANMMASPAVWPAMADAFRSADGSLPRRLLTALQAAQHAGGDARGVMSAALIVVSAVDVSRGGGVICDLRVDRSDDPLAELARLVDAAEAYGRYNHALHLLFGGGSVADALAELDAAHAALPADGNVQFARAGALLAAGERDRARTALQELVNRTPGWMGLARSFAAKGLLGPVTAEALEGLYHEVG